MTDEYNYKEITKLKKDCYYIQVGSFVVKANAIRVSSDLNKRKFETVIYEDPDGLYKVLIEGQDNMEEMLYEAKEHINSGSFMKKRL